MDAGGYIPFVTTRSARPAPLPNSAHLAALDPELPSLNARVGAAADLPAVLVDVLGQRLDTDRCRVGVQSTGQRLEGIRQPDVVPVEYRDVGAVVHRPG